MRLVYSKSGVARVVIALIVIIVFSGIAAAYIAFRPPASSPSLSLTSSPSPSPTSSPSPSPSPTPTTIPVSNPTPTPVTTTKPTQTPTQSTSPTPTPTPTSSPTPTPTATPKPAITHTVGYEAMQNPGSDTWNQALMTPYTITLTDSMTVSSGNQDLKVTAYNSTDSTTQWYIWQVEFINSTYIQFTVDNLGGANYMQGNLFCVNGVVQVVVTQSTVTFIGTSSYSVNMNFQSPEQIQTANGDGNFNGGSLLISVRD